MEISNSKITCQSQINMLKYSDKQNYGLNLKFYFVENAKHNLYLYYTLLLHHYDAVVYWVHSVRTKKV